MASVYDFRLKDIDGNDTSLEKYRGKVLLLVNVASECGLTPQYAELQQLHERYEDQGFVVLGFPANNFGAQEPGSDEEIKDFCSLNYRVTFPMFSKISVKGEGIHPLFKHLTGADAGARFGGDIKWNFNKFLVGKDGQVLARFEPQVKPSADEVVQAVEEALRQEAGAVEKRTVTFS